MVKKLINIIKDAIIIYKKTKKEKTKIKIGMCFYNSSRQKYRITHILNDEPETQIVYKGYYKNIKQWIYFVEEAGYFNRMNYAKNKDKI